MPVGITSEDEGRHSAEGLDWEECWHFEVVASDLAAFARLTIRADGSAWVWAYLLRPDLPVLAVRDHDVVAPRGSRLMVRAEALWLDLTCEDPLDHWSVGVEAFGVLLDDPADALAGERGERTGLGFDLSWEALGPPEPVENGYRVAARVDGEMLTGQGAHPTVTAIEASGSWTHRWGPPHRPAEGPARPLTAAEAWIPAGDQVIVESLVGRPGHLALHERLLS